MLGFGMFGSWMLVPLLVAQPAATGAGFGASPTVVGLIMLPNAVGTLLVMPLGRRLGASRGPRATLLVGTVVVTAAYAFLAAAHGTLILVIGAVLMMGAGVGLAFAAVAAIVVESVPLAQTAVSAGINTVMRTIGGALGATVGGSLLTSSLGPTGFPTPQAYTTAMITYTVALAGAALLASRVPQAARHPVPAETSPPPAAASERRHRPMSLGMTPAEPTRTQVGRTP